MKSSAEFIIRLPAAIRKEGSMYVSFCPALDVYSCGETPERAKENLVEAVRLFISDCFARGTLDQVLRDCGFVAAPQPKKKPAPADKTIEVSLPFDVHRQLAQCLA